MAKLLTEETFKKWGKIGGIDKSLTENAFQRVNEVEDESEDEMNDMNMDSSDEMDDMDMDVSDDEGLGGELELSKDELEVITDVLEKIKQASGSDMELDEMSSMGGGSASGHMGAKKIGNKENKMKPIKEEDLDEKCDDKELEEELAESLALKTYQKFLKEQKKSKRRKEMLENIDVDELSERIQKRLQELQ